MNGEGPSGEGPATIDEDRELILAAIENRVDHLAARRAYQEPVERPRLRELARLRQRMTSSELVLLDLGVDPGEEGFGGWIRHFDRTHRRALNGFVAAVAERRWERAETWAFVFNGLWGVAA